MPLTKTLAAISAGALLLIGQSALAQDPYTDRTQDRTATTQTQTEDERDRSATVRTDDDEFTAETTWDDEDDEFAAEAQWEDERDTTDTTFQDDEFAAEAEVQDDEFRAETEYDDDRQVGVDVHVDDDKLNTLADIHLEMQDETRELADELAVADSAEQAQEFQAQMVDRQVGVIERHGWSRDEYNRIVDQVNEDPQLRAEFMDMIVQRDEQVAGTAETDADAEFRAEAEVQEDEFRDDEFRAEAEFDDDDDWESTAFEDDDFEDRDDETVADLEDDRDW